MVNTRLQIGTNPNVCYIENIPISVNYQISEVRTPDARKGSISKTINLPGSPDINILFENAFEVNVSFQTFNPKLKIDAIYFVDEIPTFKGSLRLMDILIDDSNGKVIYQCNIIGQVINLFTAIQNKYLTDIDFSNYETGVGIVNYNHTLNYTSITNSWATTPGIGYVYPLIDWGTNNSNLSFVRPQDLRACIFAREYLFGIFNMAGYTWTSTFLDSTFFKRLIIPPTETPTLSQSTLNNNKFLAVADGSQTITNTLTLASPVILYSSTSTTTIGFQTETYDVGNHFNNTGAGTNPNPYSWYPAVTNIYNTVVNIGLNFVVKKNGTDVSSSMTGVSGTVTVIATWGSATINVSNINWAAGNSNNVSIPLLNTQLNANNNYNCSVQFTNLVLQSSSSLTGTWTIETTIVSGSNFSSEFASASVIEGSSVNINDCIPLLIKQTDFFSWLIKMFNLYVTIDPANPKNLIIEDRPNFYHTTSIDWTYKSDDSKEDEIIPLGELDIYKAKYSYKSDGDYYNKTYEDQYGYTYGYKEQLINGDFNTSDSSTEVGFSATPYAQNPIVPSIVTPVIIKKESSLISPTRPNIRILYWSGQITMPTSQWTLSYNNGSSWYTSSTYPHAGHTDNPFAPTLDLNFGYPNKLFYVYPNLYWTTNNLYNKYYSKYINQISDKNSKILIGYFNLTSDDINKFDFRYPVFYKDAYWLVNKIIDYNPLVKQTTKVELLKLTDYDEFIPGTVLMNGGLGDQNLGNAFVIGNSILNSPDSVNLGNASMISGGSGNYIAATPNG